MSQQYQVKKAILELMSNPEDKEKAVELFMHAIDVDEEDFEYENDATPHEYLFGND